jgi:hypothetical protein
MAVALAREFGPARNGLGLCSHSPAHSPTTKGVCNTSEILLVISLVIRGAGFAAVTIPVTAAAYRGLRPGQVPHARPGQCSRRVLQRLQPGITRRQRCAAVRDPILQEPPARATDDLPPHPRARRGRS